MAPLFPRGTWNRIAVCICMHFRSCSEAWITKRRCWGPKTRRNLAWKRELKTEVLGLKSALIIKPQYYVTTHRTRSFRSAHRSLTRPCKRVNANKKTLCDEYHTLWKVYLFALIFSITYRVSWVTCCIFFWHYLHMIFHTNSCCFQRKQTKRALPICILAAFTGQCKKFK